MPVRQSYARTETEILALQLHRNLHGHSTYPEDFRVLVAEIERRQRRSEGVQSISDEGRRYLADQKSDY
jgi:hypothetical protein